MKSPNIPLSLLATGCSNSYGVNVRPSAIITPTASGDTESLKDEHTCVERRPTIGIKEAASLQDPVDLPRRANGLLEGFKKSLKGH